MKKVLVTGVTGFIGSHLGLDLSRKGYEVYGVTKRSTSRDLRRLHNFLKDIVLLTCDVSDYQSLSQLLRSVEPDIVVHLAALSPVRDSFEKPFTYIQNNVTATVNLAHIMLELPDYKHRKLVYASTAEVYGFQRTEPIKEDAPLNPSSPYANTKAMTDMYLRMLSQVYGLNATIMRCTNTYGRKLDTSFYIEYLVTSMLKNEDVYVGMPNSVRDYMYVDDHVNAYLSAIEHLDVKGEAFNAGTGEKITNKEVAIKIAEIVGYERSKIILGKYPPNYPTRPAMSDQPFIVLDSKKIQTQLGWVPRVPLEEGLKRVVEYWKGQLQ